MKLLYLVVTVLTAVLVPAQILLDHWLKYVFKDGRTSEHRIFRRVLLTVTLVVFFGGLVGGILKHSTDEDEKLDLNLKLTSLKDSNTNLVQEVQSLRGVNTNLVQQVESLRTDNFKQRNAISSLMQAQIDNEKTDLEARQKMLASKMRYEIGAPSSEDLDALVSQFKNRKSKLMLEREAERLKTVEDQKRYLTPHFPIWDYAIRTFQAMLASYSRTRGGRVSSDFVSLPTIDALCRGYTSETGGYGKNVPVCEISLGTNIAWNCKCVLWIPDRMGTPRHYASLSFVCSGKKGSSTLSVGLNSANDKVGTSLSCREMPSIAEEYPLNAYKKGVDGALQNLIAAEADEVFPSGK